MRAPDHGWERARRLFDRARRRSPEERSAFLDAACPDPQLRTELEDLLRAHDALESRAGEGFLVPDPEMAGRLLASEAAGDTELDPVPEGVLGRYRIVRPVARGGMGVVYLAHDTRLDRPAALKLLPVHRSLDPEARERFEAEARAASALDHPNIATVYEIGDAPDGGLFIAMAFCPGETARELLDRGPLPVPRALSLALQLAGAVAEAHRQGVVHRDLKPGNVIVGPADHARLVDFGIAKLPGTSLTGTGITPGTVAYMSPEQTRGHRADPRSDVWALGATLYEMLAGRRPFEGDDRDAVIFAIRHDEPESLERAPARVPAGLARVVARCLRKDPKERYRDGAHLLAALRSLGTDGGARVPGRWRPAVVGVGALGVLVLAVGGASLWSMLPTDDPVEVPALQGRIGGEVATAPGFDPGPGSGFALAAPGTGAGDEHAEYLKGRYYLGKHDAASFGTARDHFRRALDLDPTFARAWSGLAHAYMHLAGILGLPASEAYPLARAAAERALGLDPELAEAHAALAMALAIHEWEPEAAEHHFLRALELDPSSASAHWAYAQYLRNRARLDEAMVAVLRAQELDPFSASSHMEEAIIHYAAGRHDEAIAKARRLLAAQPDLVMAYHGIALNHVQQGRYAQAIDALDRMSVGGSEVNTLGIRAVILARAGREAEARRSLARLEELARDAPVSAFHRAAVHVSLGETELAMDLLEEGEMVRADYLQLLRIEPIFAPLRPEARFQALLRRIGLEG